MGGLVQRDDAYLQVRFTPIQNHSEELERSSAKPGLSARVLCIVLFRPGLAWKPRLWLGLRGLWLHQTSGQAKAANQGLALAWLGLGPGFTYNFLTSIHHRLAWPTRSIGPNMINFCYKLTNYLVLIYTCLKKP